MSQNFNKQPAQGPHSALSGLGVLQSEGAAPAPAGAPATAWVAIQSHTGAADQRIYVMCHQCEVCQHIGINDERPTESACNRSSCGWHGPSPSEDLCPGCGETGTMSTACPECGGHYVLLAEANIVPTSLSGVAAPAGASKILRTGSTLYELNAMGYNRWSALVQPGHDDNDKRISESECERIAAALSGAPAVAAEPLAVLRDLIGCVDTYDRLKRLHEMGHGTDHDSTRCRFAEAVERARELVKAHGIGSPGAKEDGQHG